MPAPLRVGEGEESQPVVLFERLASERALREQSLAYERELRAEGRTASHLLSEQMARSHELVHRAESTARDKAENAVDKRLEAMNEFRDQLRSRFGFDAQTISGALATGTHGWLCRYCAWK